MRNRDLVKIFLLSVLLFLLVSCSSPATETTPAPTVTTDVPPGKTIVLGDISDDPGEVIEGTQPLADYIAAQLVDFGFSEGSVTIASSADEMTSLLVNGQVDLYFDSVFPATLISDASGAIPILRRWRYGVEEYHTVIFASAESGITSIQDLPGNLIAFDNPYSTSGFLLPTVYLAEQGLELVGKKSYNDPVGEQELGFVFSFDDENTLQWVMSGLVAAGATDNYNYDVLFPEEAAQKLVVLARTESVPRQVVVARPGMDQALLDAIIQILITAHETEGGATALVPFQTSRFDEFPEGIEAAIERMREMMAIVQYIPMP